MRGTDLSMDTNERRFRFPKRFREGLWSLQVGLSRAIKKESAGVEGHHSPKEILAGLTSKGPDRADWWESVHELLPDFRLISSDLSSSTPTMPRQLCGPMSSGY